MEGFPKYGTFLLPEGEYGTYEGITIEERGPKDFERGL